MTTVTSGPDSCASAAPPDVASAGLAAGSDCSIGKPYRSGEVMNDPSAVRAYAIDVLVFHRWKQRQRDDTGTDVFRDRIITGLEAHLAIKCQQVNCRVVHADADACSVHRMDEFPTFHRLRQHDLEHVPVAVAEVFDRQLTSERTIEMLEVTPCEHAAARVEFIQPAKLADADARCDIGHIVLAPGQTRIQVAIGKALYALQPPQLAALGFFLV